MPTRGTVSYTHLLEAIKEHIERLFGAIAVAIKGFGGIRQLAESADFGWRELQRLELFFEYGKSGRIGNGLHDGVGKIAVVMQTAEEEGAYRIERIVQCAPCLLYTSRCV